ncbi:MAG: potassium-transporting ATPase subunit KdpC [Elusimicrobia bacterium]|nr:potassium-transporting ATPase subunit KdpC [Elusimicrobiota bacterium]
MFIRQLKTAILALAVLSALTGLIYPLAVTAVAQLCLARQANGSFLLREGKPAGSQLIGQPFDDPKFFWGRLSATDVPYNASNSSGSNLGPLNPALLKAVQARIQALKDADRGNTDPIPVDLVTASASGLDPHISPAAAYYQARRVAGHRGIPEEDIRLLIERHTQGRWLGILGEPAVNVLELNLELNNMHKSG